MKKYFPIILPFMVFTGFLAAQIAFNIVSTSLGQSDKEKKISVYYENLYSEKTFQGSKGESIALSKIKAPIVIVNFWASWCTPCLKELPSLVKIVQTYGTDKIFVVGINADEENQLREIERISAKYSLNFPTVPDKGGGILNDFMVSGIPTTLIFHKGKLQEKIQGEKDFSSIETRQMFNKLLKG